MPRPSAGVVIRLRNQFELARNSFDEALRRIMSKPMARERAFLRYRRLCTGTRRHRSGDQAIRLSPDDEYFHQQRGHIHLATREMRDARADFAKARQVDPFDPYAALWVYISARRSGFPGALDGSFSEREPNEWPSAVIKLYLEQSDRDAVLQAAKDADAITERDQICSANFYLGEFALMEGDEAKARSLFKLVRDSCRREITDQALAAVELRSLENAR